MNKDVRGGATVATRGKGGMPAMKEEMAMPKPLKEHEWLRQLVGKWHAEVEAVMEAGQPPECSEGTETVHMVGDFWILSEYKGTFMGKPFRGILTLGYSPRKKKYVGTWIDSIESHLWQYEGTLDPGGKILTLETEGSCPTTPDKLTRFNEVIQLEDADHRRFTSSMLSVDGAWIPTMAIKYTRG